jgi:hypothetical protein
LLGLFLIFAGPFLDLCWILGFIHVALVAAMARAPVSPVFTAVVFLLLACCCTAAVGLSLPAPTAAVDVSNEDAAAALTLDAAATEELNLMPSPCEAELDESAIADLLSILEALYQLDDYLLGEFFAFIAPVVEEAPLECPAETSVIDRHAPPQSFVAAACGGLTGRFETLCLLQLVDEMQLALYESDEEIAELAFELEVSDQINNEALDRLGVCVESLITERFYADQQAAIIARLNNWLFALLLGLGFLICIYCSWHLGRACAAPSRPAPPVFHPVYDAPYEAL